MLTNFSLHPHLIVESTSAREKFGTQKAISSDQYFGRGGYDSKAQSEANTRLQAFSGATAISSSQYFGRDETQHEEEEGNAYALVVLSLISSWASRI